MLALSVLSIASAALTGVSALSIPHHHRRGAPQGWAYGYLEDYDTYHTRYLALSCQTQHDTEFFDQCCHPLLATENLKDNREPQCTPSASSSSPAPESAPTEDSGEDCDDEDDESTDSTQEPTSTEQPTQEPTQEPTTTQESEPTSTPDQTPTTTEQAPPTETSQSGGGSDSGDTSGVHPGQLHSGGFATYYFQGGNAGNCGDSFGDDAYIAAVAFSRYGDLGRKSDACGQSVTVTNTKNGKQVTVKVADSCEACAFESLDLSQAAFRQIADESDGQVPITWSYN